VPPGLKEASNTVARPGMTNVFLTERVAKSQI
jgi:hypothetical protein